MGKSKSGKKYYAVSDGRTPGVYMNWSDCNKQVNGYSNCRFKSFETAQEAANFVQEGGSNSRSVQSYNSGGSYGNSAQSYNNSYSSGRSCGGTYF